ncbi:hypothetical protein MFLAVUS_001344 [Mucor flavus]|uniref:Uncharacterized protein n=1 Tax=Mucor flavus TaxID=439312 RepID=A0ABP9YMA2_9FUNG
MYTAQYSTLQENVETVQDNLPQFADMTVIDKMKFLCDMFGEEGKFDFSHHKIPKRYQPFMRSLSRMSAKIMERKVFHKNEIGHTNKSLFFLFVFITIAYIYYSASMLELKSSGSHGFVLAYVLRYWIMTHAESTGTERNPKNEIGNFEEKQGTKLRVPDDKVAKLAEDLKNYSYRHLNTDEKNSVSNGLNPILDFSNNNNNTNSQRSIFNIIEWEDLVQKYDQPFKWNSIDYITKRVGKSTT